MATNIHTTKTSSGGSGGSSVKTTTYETTRSYQAEEPVYRPKLMQRSLVIQRGGAPGGQSMMQRSQSSSYGSNMISPQAYQAVSALGVANVKTSRDQEKKDMQDLNERFAGYIERVRFLEAQNRKLADELDKLKAKWGKETTAIKAMYQAELDEARKLLDESEKDKATLQVRHASLEAENEELREKNERLGRDAADLSEKLNKQNEQLSTYESEINLLQRRVECMENEREKDKREIARLTEALNRTRMDLDNETLLHIDAENRRQTLEEELEFMKQVHEQEMKELAALAYRDTTNENREFWKSEMSQAMREIQGAYDEKLDTMRGELETYYNMKVQEFRTGAAKHNMETVHAKEEVKRLRGQLTDLRAKLGDAEMRNAQLERDLAELRREFEERTRELELEKATLSDQVLKRTAELDAILKELQDLMDSKLGLELEIAAYRKLLEGEENNLGLRQVVESIIDQKSVRRERADEAMSMYTVRQTEQMAGDSSLKVSQVVKGEMSAKTTYQRSAKGSISIHECGPDGSYIIIENTTRKDEPIGNWRLERTCDGTKKMDFEFPQGFTMRGGQKLKIVADGAAAGYNDLVAKGIKQFGVGANITTKLMNVVGEDRATHVQRTVYTS